MRRALRSTALSAAALVGASAFAVGAAVVPAQAAATATGNAYVRPASPAWHYIGRFQTSYHCEQEGRRYMDNDWGIRFECRPAPNLTYDLWVLTDL